MNLDVALDWTLLTIFVVSLIGGFVSVRKRTFMEKAGACTALAFGLVLIWRMIEILW